MTMQAFPIVVGVVQLDLFRRRWSREVIDVDVAQPAQLGFGGAEHRVAGVAGVTGLVRWYPMGLEVGCAEIRRIVNPETLSVRLPDVAGARQNGGLLAFRCTLKLHRD